MKKPELLAPAGTFEKMKTAFKYGADAVYFAGKKYGLRAFAGNFEENEISEAVKYAHTLGKKVYITLNILAHEDDFTGLDEYLALLENAKVDAVIASDLGIISYIREKAPTIDIHVSTQANVLNSYAINYLAKLGIKRIILARELSLEEIKKIKSKIPPEIELECFVHGAMCISYSGRCLLSNYLAGRDSNRGACAQPCRWEYTITEKKRKGEQYAIQEDDRGTYILNSKDMCMLEHLEDIINAGVCSLKIEGRMKSEYYVATVVNAYHREIERILGEQTTYSTQELKQELEKASHRRYTTAFYYGSNDKEYLESSMPVQTHEFIAIVVTDWKNDEIIVQQRNRFKIGDELEILSADENFNKKIIIEEMYNDKGEKVEDAKNVQEILHIKTDYKLKSGDILRKKLSSTPIEKSN